MKLEINCVEYTDELNGTYLHIFGRDENDERKKIKIKGPNPYFYILTKENKKNNMYAQNQIDGYKSIFREDLTKVEVKYPRQVKQTRPLYSKTYEADVIYPTRWMIDNSIWYSIDENFKEINFDSNMRICYIDIETKYYGGANSDMSDPITSISFFDNYKKQFGTLYHHESIKENSIIEKKYRSKISDIEYPWKLFSYTSEKSLLEGFIKLMNICDFDIFTGWNVKKFDMTYILRRLDYCKIPKGLLSPMNKCFYDLEKKECMIRGRTILDLMAGYKRIYWHQIESFKLDNIGKSEFKIGKVKHIGWMGDFWKNNLEDFLIYNIRDVDICVELNKKYDIIGFLNNLRRLSGCEFSDVHMNSRMFDIFILRKCFGKYVLPTKGYSAKMPYEKRTHKFEGGLVTTPIPGRLLNVSVLDLKSLYPSIMIAFNLSPERIDANGEITTVTGIKIDKKPGLIRNILIELIALRDSIRKDLPTITDKSLYYKTYKKQYAVKTFTNSAYGIMGYKNFRLYNVELAETVTKTARYLLGRIISFVKDKGFKVVRADTDSVFIEFGSKYTKEEIIKINKSFAKEINTKILPELLEGMNCDSKYLLIKFEKIYDVFFSGNEKKVYCGHISYKDGVDTDEIEIKGFAAKRSDRSRFTRQIQKKVLHLILSNASDADIKKYILEEIRRLKNMEYPFEFVGLPKGLSKPIEKYKVTSPWIRGVKYALQKIPGYQFSPKPYLIYIKGISHEICFNNEEEIDKNIQLDFNKMIDISIVKPLSKILEVLNIDEHFIFNQSTILDFENVTIK